MINGKIYTYLAGPMEDENDGGKNWRERVSMELNKYFGNLLIIQDPCKMELEKLKDFVTDIPFEDIKTKMMGWRKSGHWEKFDPAMERVIDVDLQCLKQSDFIIIFLKFFDTKGNKIQMGGTISELTYAYRHRIPIYAVCYNKISECNSWIIRMGRGINKPIKDRKIYNNFNQVIEIIKEDFKKFKTLDNRG